MTLVDSAAAVAVECAGSVVQGTLGFGLNLVVVPLLVLINPHFAPGAVVLAGATGALLVVARERGGADWRSIGWALGGRLPGNAVGIAIIATVAATFTEAAIGALVIVGVVVSACGLRLKRTPWTMVQVGGVSGVLGTVAGLGGPPFALLCHDMDTNRFRVTAATYSLLGMTASAVMLTSAHELGFLQLRLFLLLLPGVLLGVFLSRFVIVRIARSGIRWAVYVVAIVGASGAIAQGLR